VYYKELKEWSEWVIKRTNLLCCSFVYVRFFSLSGLLYSALPWLVRSLYKSTYDIHCKEVYRAFLQSDGCIQ
jgi:hypothetical protein